MTTITSLSGRRVDSGNPLSKDIVLSNGKSGGQLPHQVRPAAVEKPLIYAMTHVAGQRRCQGPANVNGLIADALIGMDIADQNTIDATLIALDPSPLKDTWVAMPQLPRPLQPYMPRSQCRCALWRHVSNIYHRTHPPYQKFKSGDGAHAGRRVDIQDFMIMVPAANSFEEVAEITNEVYFAAGDIMASRGALAGVADEGGWWPMFESNEQAWKHWDGH